MTEKDIIGHMVTELDYFAREYQFFTDAKARENIESEFKAHVRSYNALLRNIHHKISYVAFTRKIETYIEQRKEGVWGEKVS